MKVRVRVRASVRARVGLRAAQERVAFVPQRTPFVQLRLWFKVQVRVQGSDYGYGHLLVWVVVVVVAGVVVTAFKGWRRISVSVCGVERGQR